MIGSIAFTVYPVRDIVRARKFYENVLGLKLTHDFRGQWLEYDLGDSTFALSSMDMQRQPGAPGALVAFETGDYDAFIQRLKDAGVKFVLDTFETPVCRMAVIADPDDNHIVVHKRKS